MSGCPDINSLPDVNLAQIFEKLPYQKRLQIERVCKRWHHVAKSLSWSNFKTFDNGKYRNWSEPSIIQIKPFIEERCGRFLRHLTLRYWSPPVVLSFIRLAPQVQHLRLWSVKLMSEHIRELAQILPHLKSLDLEVSLWSEVRMGAMRPTLWQSKSAIKQQQDSMKHFQDMTSLEYLYIYEKTRFFDQNNLIQFPSSLKYLALYGINSADQILFWAEKQCKNLKGLRLTYFATRWLGTGIEFVFEALTELRALEIYSPDEKIISAITKSCKKLEHVNILDDSLIISAEKHANMLHLATLPNLCSVAIQASSYSKQQTTELVNRLIAKGNMQYIQIKTSDTPLESAVLFEILHHCKNIKTIDLHFNLLDVYLYSTIDQMVDEVGNGMMDKVNVLKILVQSSKCNAIMRRRCKAMPRMECHKSSNG
ncbi:f-box-like domain-containing protein [Ditylenchus destructor]|uniref:F-box-like domain-containing protein n=1 Tax=Ditylenchus destructor TaxID=166010 RepID=A0AAD4MIL4_9BILA|nr:f-box-like domain-containing protein [Ditylenchus destructor]